MRRTSRSRGAGARSAGRWLCVLLVLAATFLPAGAALAQDDLLDQLKVEYIERFTRFIEWPGEGTRGSKDQDFVLCVYGQSPVTQSFRRLAARQPVKDRPAAVRELADLAELRELIEKGEDRKSASCQVLFLPAAAGDELEAILEPLAEQPVLTLGDTAGFAERGVLINFFLEEEFLRFEINAKAAEKSGLRFSSRLLRLGSPVEPR